MKNYFSGAYYAASRLPDTYRDALEQIFYFNENQWRMQLGMLHAIEEYGIPRLVSRQGLLALEIDRLPDVQCLYILKSEGATDRLSGVVVYTREGKTIHVIYVGLEPADAHGAGEKPYLFIDVCHLLTRIARQIRGVELIEFNRGPRRLRLSVEAF